VQETTFKEMLIPPGRPAALSKFESGSVPLRAILSDGLPFSNGFDIFYYLLFKQNFLYFLFKTH